MTDPPHRRLAAVLFSDIVGYSAQVSDDEAAALARLEVHNRIFNDAVDGSGGRVVKTIGDGFMVEFASAVDAVSCGLEVQHQLQDHNAEASTGERIDVRIGVHVGDVVERDQDLFGETVNLAARLEAKAPSGAVCVSGAVYVQLHRQVHANCEELGQLRLKGIERPVGAFALRPSEERLDTHLTNRPPPAPKPEPRGKFPTTYALIGVATLLGIGVIYFKSLASQPERAQTVAAEPSSTAATPVSSELRIAGYGPRGVFDYYNSVPTLAANALREIAEPLVRRSPEGEALPGVIAKWTSSEDARSVDLELAAGVRFHAHRCLKDGKARPAHARDVAYSVELAVLHAKSMLPLTGREQGRRHIDGVVTVGPNTVRLTFEQPVALPARQLHNVWLLPEGFGDCENVRDAGVPIGTGPFRFTGGAETQSLVLERNEHYWDATARAKVARLELRALDDGIEAIRRLSAGELDIFGGIARGQEDSPIRWGEDGPQIEERYQKAGLLVGTRTINYWTVYGLVFLHHAPKLAGSAEVRRIISAALQREPLCALVEIETTPTARFFGSRLLGYDAAIEPQQLDTSEAKRALALLNIKQERVLTIGTGGANAKVVEALGAQLAEIGIELRAVDTGSGSNAKLVESGGVDALLANVSTPLFGNEPHAGGILSLLRRVGHEDAELSKLVEAVQGERSRTQRAELLSQLEARLLETAPMVIICRAKQGSLPLVYVASPRVHGFIDPMTRRVIEGSTPLFAGLELKR